MSLSARLAEASNPRRGPRCSVAVLLDKLAVEDPQGLADLQAAIDNKSLSTTVIVRALQESGHDTVRTDAIRRHRRRGGPDGCRCS